MTNKVSGCVQFGIIVTSSLSYLTACIHNT